MKDLELCLLPDRMDDILEWLANLFDHGGHLHSSKGRPILN